MQWQLRTLDKVSFISQKPFEEDQEVICLVFVDENSQIARVDILPEELENENLPKNIIGKWTRKFNIKNQDVKLAKKLALSSSEELFLSLFSNDIDFEEKEIFKHLLALLLERKRILRPVGKAKNSVQDYLHIKTQTIYKVNEMKISMELILKISSQIEALII